MPPQTTIQHRPTPALPQIKLGTKPFPLQQKPRQQTTTNMGKTDVVTTPLATTPNQQNQQTTSISEQPPLKPALTSTNADARPNHTDARLITAGQVAIESRARSEATRHLRGPYAARMQGACFFGRKANASKGMYRLPGGLGW
jgi:hypothetical protein